jgi:hypothetical protein
MAEDSNQKPTLAGDAVTKNETVQPFFNTLPKTRTTGPLLNVGENSKVVEPIASPEQKMLTRYLQTPVTQACHIHYLHSCRRTGECCCTVLLLLNLRCRKSKCRVFTTAFSMKEKKKSLTNMSMNMSIIF